MGTVEGMSSETERVECRLCGLVIRENDSIVVISDEPLHAPCAESAFSKSSAWKHASITTLSQMARGQGSAAAPY